jgi:TM2 domain-containing membrane protein YozV
MKIYVKAALLSAFVLPGMGQIYKGAKVKGGIMIGLVNVFLLTAFFLVMKGIGALLVTARLSGLDAAAGIIAGLRDKVPAVKLLSVVFFFLWAYSVVDALFKEEKKDNRNMV